MAKNASKKRDEKGAKSGKPAKKSAEKAVKGQKLAVKGKAAPVKPTRKAQDTKPAALRAPQKVEKDAKLKKNLEEKVPVAAVVSPPPAAINAAVLNLVTQPVAPMETVLTDAEGRPYCKVKDCDQLATVEGYCRYHYLLLWKRIQVRRKILDDGKLQRYVEELTARYPDKFLEVIRKDLRSEKDFLSAIQELEIDESNLDSDFEEDTESIDEVRSLGGGDSGMMDEDSF